MLSSLDGVNIFTPVQPQASSAATGSSLFAGLSVKDTISPTQTTAVSSNLSMASTTLSQLSESTTKVSNLDAGTLSYNQPVMASISAPSNTSSSSYGILQPQVTTSVMHNQPMPSSIPLQPKPAMSSYSTTYQPPPIVPSNSSILQPNKSPAVTTSVPSITEAPPPYPGHEKHSTVTSSFETGTQQLTLMRSSHLRTGMLQPQPSVLQPARPVVSPQNAGPTVNSNMGSTAVQPPAHNPTVFGANMLQPQQPNVLMSTQPASTVMKPQIAGTGNITPSVATSAQLPTSNPLQMQGAHNIPMQAPGNVVDPRAHSSTILLPQKTTVTSAPAGTPYGGNIGTINMAAGTSVLFQQPLIASPPVAETLQGSQYIMSPGANPFSDINDLL